MANKKTPPKKFAANTTRQTVPTPIPTRTPGEFPWAFCVTWHMRAGELVAILRDEKERPLAAVAFAQGPLDVVNALSQSIRVIQNVGADSDFVEIGFAEAAQWSEELDKANRKISTLTGAMGNARKALEDGRRGDAMKILAAHTKGDRAPAAAPGDKEPA